MSWFEFIGLRIGVVGWRGIGEGGHACVNSRICCSTSTCVSLALEF